MQDDDIKKIIADPFAPEARWLHACAAGKDLPARRDLSPGAALMTSAALAASTSAYAMFAYDWGREILEEFIGNVHAGTEVSIAVTINLCIILPVAYGLFSGYLQKRKEPGTIAGALVLASAGVASSIALFGVLPVWAFGFAGVGLVAAAASHGFGSMVRQEMQSKSMLRRVFKPALLYLIPAALLALANLDGNFGFREEVAVFLSLLFLSCSWAAARCRAKTFSAGMAAAFFCALPVLAINAINMCGLLAVLLFHSVHFVEALTSTLIVVGSTGAAAMAGGCYGTVHGRRLAAMDSLVRLPKR